MEWIDCDDAFVTVLANNGCITWRQRNELRDTNRSVERTGKLIDFLQRRSIADFDKFTCCLARHQAHLVKLLVTDGGKSEHGEL